MTGIEKITGRIEADARAEAAQITAEAKAKCDAIKADYEKKAQDAYWEKLQAGVKDCEDRVERLFERYQVNNLGLCGGVAANPAVRATLERICKRHGAGFFAPELSLCGDNAVMIGSQAYYEYMAGNIADGSLNAVPAGEI